MLAGKKWASLASRAVSPSIGQTYLTSSIEWFLLFVHVLQATLLGPQIAVSIVRKGSQTLRQFVQFTSWLLFTRADVEQGAALYLLLFYATVVYISTIALMWFIIVLYQPRSR